jgi:hypothetical protein
MAKLCSAAANQMPFLHGHISVTERYLGGKQGSVELSTIASVSNR